MSLSIVRRVHVAPICPDCRKQFIYTVDNPYTEVITRMDPLQHAMVTGGEEPPEKAIKLPVDFIGLGLPEEYVIWNDFHNPDAPEFPQDVKYKLIEGKSGHGWLIPDPEYRGLAANIYRTAFPEWGKRGDGFGGSSIFFDLSNGDKFELRGGWHANASDLYEDTDIDLRRCHVTFTVVSRAVEYNQLRVKPEDGRQYTTHVMRGIVYMDPPEGVESYFMRGKHLTIAMAKQANEAFFCYSASDGGSSFGRYATTDTVRDEDQW